MDVPVSEAKALLTDLVRRAEAGEEVVLTRFGRPVARILPVAPAVPDPAARRRLLQAVRAAGRSKASPGPPAARSADDLYDGRGLPA